MSSVRERAEAAASRATADNEQLVPPDKHRATGLGHSVVVPGSVRQRVTKQEFEQAPKAPRDATCAAADFYYAEYKRKEAADKAAEAKRVKDEQQRIAQQRAQQDEARKNLAINLALTGASPKEVARVKDIVATNFPADKFNPGRHWMILQQLRDAIGMS